MIDWLSNNLNWIFSGVGVAVIIAVVGWGRRKFGPVSEKKPNGTVSYPIAQPRNTTSKITLKRCYEIRHLRLGDYTEFELWGYTVRVTLKDIRDAEVCDRWGKTVRERVSVLEINAPSWDRFTGLRVRELTPGTYQLPAGEYGPEVGVFTFANSTNHTMLVFIAVKHINPHSQEIEMIWSTLLE